MKRFHRHSPILAIIVSAAAGIGLAGLPSRAADPAPAAGQSQDMTDAIKLLSSSGDLKAADDAVAKLQAAMMNQTRQVIATQKLLLDIQTSLARELTALTGVKDAESQARVAGLLDLNAAIYNWASSVSKMEPAQRDALFEWGLKPDHLPLIAKIYGHDSASKADAIHELAKLDASTATDYMMQVLLNDSDHEITLLTLDSLFDRKPSPALADTICDHAFGWIQNQTRNQQQRQHIVVVHGRQMVYYDNQNQMNYQQDADFYADLLIQYHDPKIAERFDAVLGDFTDSITNMNDGRVMQVISSNYSNSQVFAKLINAFKPKSAVRLCIKVLQNAPGNAQDVNMNNNGVNGQYHMSTHVDAMAMLINFTGQDLNDYGILKQENYNRWAVPGNAADENDALKKMHDWLDKHGKEYGVDTVPNFTSAPGAGNPVGRRGVGGGAAGGMP